MKIAWIGLGHMGAPMSANLVGAGHAVRGFDVSGAALAAAEKSGVTAATSVAEAVQDAEAVFTMLPTGRHVLSVYEGDDGVLANAAGGARLVDSSTIDVVTTRKLDESARARGFRFLDAPVSGGVPGAAAGRLTFMVGGEAEDLEALRAVIDVMAGRIFHVGPAGQGQAAKIVNNTIAGMNLAALCEGSLLAQRLGVSGRTFYELATLSTSDSWALRNSYPIPGVAEAAAVNNGFQAGFAASLMAKDVGLGVDAATSVGLTVPLAELALSQFRRLVDEGLGDYDCSILVQLVDKASPITREK